MLFTKEKSINASGCICLAKKQMKKPLSTVSIEVQRNIVILKATKEGKGYRRQTNQ